MTDECHNDEWWTDGLALRDEIGDLNNELVGCRTTLQNIRGILDWDRPDAWKVNALRKGLDAVLSSTQQKDKP